MGVFVRTLKSFGLFRSIFLSLFLSPLSYLCYCFVCHRDAVVAVDRTISKENDNFQPYKRTRLYGITTALAQCPAGNGVRVFLKFVTNRRGWSTKGDIPWISENSLEKFHYQ